MSAEDVQRQTSGSTTGQASFSCVARQPIFDRARHTVGYELLFRSGFENLCSATDGDMATGCTLDTTLFHGLDTICNGLSAWVNCTRATLTNAYLSLMPPKQTVAEILESVEADEEILAACKKLKQAGYVIALDDFVPGPGKEPLTRLADLIKVDFRTTSVEVCRSLVPQYRHLGIKMLAEKVETAQEFELAASMGYSLFQGYFFCKPAVIAKSIATNKLSHFELLQALHNPALDYAGVETIVKKDPQLCYRLLRLVNSAALGLKVEVTSIHHAMALLGENELRKWIALVTTVAMAQGKPDELVRSALIRAKFCELLAANLHWPESDLFLLGLLSLLDAILDMSMDTILKQITVAAEIRHALLGQDNRLRRVLDLVQAYNRGDWNGCSQLTEQLNLKTEELSADHHNALRWATTVLQP
jgi:EAL and modified HD-GYP domain-containing signal transduction protein